MVFTRVGAIVVVGLALVAGPASASPNGGPGTAPLVQFGAPFSGQWAGTPNTHRLSRAGSEYPTHWWRIASYVRTGDQVQIAVDNSRGDTDVALCLLPSVDDYGADSALGACEKRERRVSKGRLDRLVIPYAGSSGQPLLVFYGGFRSGGYSATIERVIVRVKIGINSVTRVRRKFTHRAVVRYGDGTRAADGTVGVLQWSRSGRNPGPKSFTKLAGARSVKGTLRFKAKLPKYTRNSVMLRSCVIQPGGGASCTQPYRVRLRR